MTGVEVVTATSSTDCCSCSAESNKANECCSLWKLFSFCRRKHRAGSEASLIKSGLASSSSSVGASKRTLTSHDGVLAVPAQLNPAPSFDLVDDSRSPPSYLGASRCVGGYSTFTNYAPDRGRLPQPATEATPPPPATTDSAVVMRVSEVPKGGQQCRVTLVDDVVADVRTLSNGGDNVVSFSDDTDDGLVSDCHTSSINVNVKDGAYFLALVDGEQSRLQQLCCRTERHLVEPNGTVPEEVQGKMRSAIGKANLLTTKKFRQFRQLCNENLSQRREEPFQTTDADLAGFWDMVLLQVADVDRMFTELDELRRHNWITNNAHLVTESSSSNEVSTRSSSGSKARATSRTARPTPTSPTVKSTKSEMSSRARHEARQRLAAAKLAGRQRKASDSDNDVEIFIS